MKKIFFLIVFLFTTILLKSQVKIPEGSFSFTFPNEDWKYYNTITNSDNSKVYMFAYSNETTTDSTSPILRIYTEPNVKYETGLEFSIYHFIESPFDALTHFTDDKRLPNKNAIGYVGSYIDSKGIKYKLLIINFLNKKHGIEFKFIVKEDIFKLYEDDFNSILESINLKN